METDSLNSSITLAGPRHNACCRKARLAAQISVPESKLLSVVLRTTKLAQQVGQYISVLSDDNLLILLTCNISAGRIERGVRHNFV